MDAKTIFFSLLVVGMLVFLVLSGAVEDLTWIFVTVALSLLTIGGFIKRDVITDLIKARFGAKIEKTDK